MSAPLKYWIRNPIATFQKWNKERKERNECLEKGHDKMTGDVVVEIDDRSVRAPGWVCVRCGHAEHNK